MPVGLKSSKIVVSVRKYNRLNAILVSSRGFNSFQKLRFLFQEKRVYLNPLTWDILFMTKDK